jgi:hypothetical protein
MHHDPGALPVARFGEHGGRQQQQHAARAVAINGLRNGMRSSQSRPLLLLGLVRVLLVRVLLAGSSGFCLNMPMILSHSSILAPCLFMMNACCATDSVLFQAQ